jgi:GNAT superfamily N-acetyltransferase
MTAKKDTYEVAPIPAADLTEKELGDCIAVIKKGQAVGWRSALRELPLATAIVIARKENEIVGVGAIKRERQKYAAKISRYSDVAFPSETLELGYVAVDPGHQGHGLSHRITEALLSQYKGRLFATTYNKRMKRTLETGGFVKKGKEWKGRSQMLSFWEKGADVRRKSE